MALTYKSPSQVAEEYLTYLKTLKPDVNTQQQDSDWWVRSRVVGGTVSGAYADQQLVSNDAFPQSARTEALRRHLFMYGLADQKDPQAASGLAIFTGQIGSSVPAGIQGIYGPNGNVYQTFGPTVLMSATAENVPVISIATGQDQNLLAGAELAISSPPFGIDPVATISSTGLKNGRDQETDAQMADRILAFIRSPISGGTAIDYRQWALDADPSVVDASILRFAFGLGTVGVVIAAGTSDIDTAIDNGDPIQVTPSQELVDVVQAYIDTKRPVTDCAYVMGATEVPVDVTVRVRLLSGALSDTIPGTTITQEEAIRREVMRGLYKTPAGGRQFGASGFVVASELEEVMDYNLSANPYTVGRKYQLLVDRQLEDLSATGPNLMILGNQVAVPGTITILEF